ncbi:hypothetical protein [Commensalibacter papalotli (ex Servin-Garciduenas et al. 2014)]|uniref:Uncharacterized protein n=1 Tax=Commensalibacter papalotli (ex Servin-Garciduenas et al. 2014) TaxID=1208583 RepID=W7DPS0_9PROT|nr:hypothetical protein [Commensalibacter papalotli (ex Servin-Garciduenas et al. 2014)]EUK19377.1 hypothetical protein COMX_06485 [Commensalibacter papalotli (ex Servin-Garciduenas et al. 2014)]
MSESILFPTHQSISDSMDGSVVHVDNKQSEEHSFIMGHNDVNEAQKITILQSGNDWYQKDLSHITTNLMRAEMNTTALTPSNEQNQSLNIAAKGKDFTLISPMSQPIIIPPPDGIL